MSDSPSAPTLDPDDSDLYAMYPGFSANSTPFHPDLDQTVTRRTQYKEETTWANQPGNSPSSYGFSTQRLRVPASPVHPHKVDFKFYRPHSESLRDPTVSQKPLPLLVIIHGGGFVQGTHVTEERWLLKPLATALLAPHPFCAMSIHYRLAPEHPYPVPLEDCWAALQWITSPAQIASFGIDPQRVILAGSSAGGAIAAAVAQRTLHEPVGVGLRGVLLNVPALCHPDHFPKDEYAWTSFERFSPLMVPVWHCYLGGDAAKGADKGASPMLGNLEGLPPHLLTIAGNCPLTDEGRAYAAKLEAANVDVEARVYEGLEHTFAEDHGSDSTARFWVDIRGWTKRMLQ